MRGSFMTVILDSITVIVNWYKKSSSPPTGGSLISGTTKDLAGRGAVSYYDEIRLNQMEA